ncbi:concanavalin A-like lectin/glucanase [Lentinus brumalis]|uniref:Concanavalin A-like lectin/glucanase n=1 Tax=Lentinus brumalis TaxID=2498619 RepID=A0A371CX04_9APHY|nr:concanavalin A-like lectin/glucanase [Polyporus brumalis]
MKLALVALSTLLVVTFARPSTFVERSLRRGSPGIPTRAAQRLEAPSSAAAHSLLSSNWAGVVLVSPPAGENFTEVIGSFTAPTLAPSSYTAASAWVGIDGWTWRETGLNGLFQAGIDFWMENNELTYDAWYEWVPDTSYNFTGFEISSGDVLTFRLVATSDLEGTIYLENETTGQTAYKVLDAPPSPPFEAPQLAFQNAEWIMEDFFSDGQVPLADFGSIVFTGASAKTNAGTTVDLKNATAINLVVDGKTRTNVSIDSDSSATIKYLHA